MGRHHNLEGIIAAGLLLLVAAVSIPLYGGVVEYATRAGVHLSWLQHVGIAALAVVLAAVGMLIEWAAGAALLSLFERNSWRSRD